MSIDAHFNSVHIELMFKSMTNVHVLYCLKGLYSLYYPTTQWTRNTGPIRCWKHMDVYS